jgi:hypothetical protein
VSAPDEGCYTLPNGDCVAPDCALHAPHPSYKDLEAACRELRDIADEAVERNAQVIAWADQLVAIAHEALEGHGRVIALAERLRMALHNISAEAELQLSGDPLAWIKACAEAALVCDWPGRL